MFGGSAGLLAKEVPYRWEQTDLESCGKGYKGDWITSTGREHSECIPNWYDDVNNVLNKFWELSVLVTIIIVGQLPMQVDMDTFLENPVQFHDNIEQPPPLPPKIAKGVQWDWYTSSLV